MLRVRAGYALIGVALLLNPAILFLGLVLLTRLAGSPAVAALVAAPEHLVYVGSVVGCFLAVGGAAWLLRPRPLLGAPLDRWPSERRRRFFAALDWRPERARPPQPHTLAFQRWLLERGRYADDVPLPGESATPPSEHEGDRPHRGPGPS